MNCLICGKEFEIATTRGMKPKYCSIECKKVGMDNSRKKYIDKMKKKKAEEKFKADIEARTVEPEDFKMESIAYNKEFDMEKIIFRKDEASVKTSPYVSDVMDFSRRLGAMLLEGRELQNKLCKEQSRYDKEDQELLHNIESLDVITVSQAIEIIKNNAESRTNRRDIKTLVDIMRKLVGSIPANPSALAYNAIQKKNKTNEYYANQKEAIKG